MTSGILAPDALDLLKARELALRAGSAITGARHLAAEVLRSTAAIEGFMLADGAAGDFVDLRARYTAVAQHLRNLETTALQTGCPVPATEPEDFLAVARLFYARLHGHEVTDARRLRVRELIREAGGDGATVRALAIKLHEEGLEAPRETLHRWLAEDEISGLTARTGHRGDAQRWIWHTVRDERTAADRQEWQHRILHEALRLHGGTLESEPARLAAWLIVSPGVVERWLAEDEAAGLVRPALAGNGTGWVLVTPEEDQANPVRHRMRNLIGELAGQGHAFTTHSLAVRLAVPEPLVTRWFREDSGAGLFAQYGIPADSAKEASG